MVTRPSARKSALARLVLSAPRRLQVGVACQRRGRVPPASPACQPRQPACRCCTYALNIRNPSAEPWEP